VYKKNTPIKNQPARDWFFIPILAYKRFYLFTCPIVIAFIEMCIFIWTPFCLYFKHIDEKLGLFLQAFKIFTTY